MNMNSEDIKQYRELMSQLLECEKKLQVLVLRTEVLKQEQEREQLVMSHDDTDMFLPLGQEKSVELPLERYINPLYVKKNIKYKKTQQQLYVEKYSQMFKRNEISKNMKFHHSKLGRKDGKVKYINEILDTNKFKQNKYKKNTKKEKSKDKMLDSLNNKKINDLKIYARELKIKDFSIMKKENLIKSIYEHVSKEKCPESENVDDLKILKEKEDCIENEIDIDENELNENESHENDFFDDDDMNNSDFDYE